MAGNLVGLDILAILRFFDEAIPASHRHVTSMIAVAGEDMGAGLLAHHLLQQGLTVEILQGPCTQGTPSGVRLDRWIRTSCGDEVVYYQTEIKNWSAQAIGGRVLKVNASPEALAAHKIERWEKEWDGSTLRKSGARKVLVPMKPPISRCIVEPMICYWDAMHPSGQREPLFSVQLADSTFSRLWVFSMSACLREMLASGADKVVLEMPDTVHRIAWLNRLFTVL